MNLTLRRTKRDVTGIYGQLFTQDGKLLFYTLEHSYKQKDNYSPKVPVGIYNCVRGTHRLHDLKPFETFEVRGVPNATGILFHVGNYNKDSDGCILLGMVGIPDGVGISREAFNKFMALQKDCNSFFLEVCDEL